MAYLIGVNLSNANLQSTILINADLSKANINHATFSGAVDGANLNAAQVQGAVFYFNHLTAKQIYTTASYQAHDLTGIQLLALGLRGTNFSDQNLTGASFNETALDEADFSHANLVNASFHFAQLFNVNLVGATLTNVDFGGAVLNGSDARGVAALNLSSAFRTTNLIHPDGHISGIDLKPDFFGSEQSLIVRNYQGVPLIPISVDDGVVTDTGSVVRLELDTNTWNSTISFAPGIPITLSGTLDLVFAAGTDVPAQFGRTFHLFDWTGVTPSGSFAVTNSQNWDLSHLYSTGDVMFIVAEPDTAILAAIGLLGLLATQLRTGSMRRIIARSISFARGAIPSCLVLVVWLIRASSAPAMFFSVNWIVGQFDHGDPLRLAGSRVILNMDTKAFDYQVYHGQDTITLWIPSELAVSLAVVGSDGEEMYPTLNRPDPYSISASFSFHNMSLATNQYLIYPSHWNFNVDGYSIEVLTAEPDLSARFLAGYGDPGSSVWPFEFQNSAVASWSGADLRYFATATFPTQSTAPGVNVSGSAIEISEPAGAILAAIALLGLFSIMPSKLRHKASTRITVKASGIVVTVALFTLWTVAGKEPDSVATWTKLVIRLCRHSRLCG